MDSRTKAMGLSPRLIKSIPLSIHCCRCYIVEWGTGGKDERRIRRRFIQDTALHNVTVLQNSQPLEVNKQTTPCFFWICEVEAYLHFRGGMPRDGVNSNAMLFTLLSPLYYHSTTID